MRCLNPCKNLSDGDLCHRDGNLHRHMSGDAEAAILLGVLVLRVRMGARDNSAKHHQRNAQYREKNSSRGPHVRCGVFAQHSMTIAQVRQELESDVSC